MKLTVTTFKDDLFTLEVPSDIEIENLKAYCEVESGVPADRVKLLWNGTPLSDDKKTVEQYGIADGDMLFLQQSQGVQSQRQAVPQPGGVPMMDFSGIQVPGAGPSQPSAGAGTADPSTLREILLASPRELALLKQNNPPLAEALLSGDPAKFTAVLTQQNEEKKQRDRERMAMLTGDPFDPEVQRKIAEAIQQENVNANMEAAMEFSPESFGQVHMLYINCIVNGHPVKAFVDSGAQMTIMSKACAERCNISRLIDKRWAGIAKGVGTQRILGRVHICQLELEGSHLQCSFSILEEQPMDMLLGLDMLKRHQCCIDLARNVLVIGTTQKETRFLNENELPGYARLNRTISTEEHEREMAESIVQNPTPIASSHAGASTSNQSTSSDASIQKLTASGYTREQAIEALTKSNGDPDKALISLLAASLQTRK